MARRPRRRRRRNKFATLLGLVLIVVLLALATKTYASKKFKNEVEKEYKDILSGELSETRLVEKDYSKSAVIGAYYPKFGSKKIDSETKSMVDSYIGKFKEKTKGFKSKDISEIPTLKIDFKEEKLSDNIRNIDFRIVEDLKSLGQGFEENISRSYNLEEDRSLEIEDLLIDQANTYLKTKSFVEFAQNEEIKAAVKAEDYKFKDFKLEGDAIVFLVEGQPLKVNFDDLDMYSKLDFASFNKLSDQEIEEKIEIAEKMNKIRPGLDPNKPMIALTYDDGPSRKATPIILDTLEEYGAAGTFFVLGENVGYYPELVKRMADGGHEIGNHSFSHKQLTKLSVEGLRGEIDSTQKAVRDIVGYEPQLVRPTYGAINDRVKENIGMPMMLWSVDTLDWKYRNADRVTQHILNYAKDGDIVLMHDLYESTAEATRRIVPELSKRGFQLVTLSEMYQLKGVELLPGGRYTNIE